MEIDHLKIVNKELFHLWYQNQVNKLKNQDNCKKEQLLNMIFLITFLFRKIVN
jgi:hypothetical protein